MKLAKRLMTGFAVTLLAACTVPGTNTFVGGGALPFSALAVTSIDTETGNPSYKALLSWSAPLNFESRTSPSRLFTVTPCVASRTSTSP